MSTADPTPPSDSPPIPLVIVAGPLRSGGEAIAEALGAMGFGQVGGRSGSPPGGNDEASVPDSEATRLGRVGDELLGLIEGTWWAPPDPISGWEELPEIGEAATRGLVAVEAQLGTDSELPNGMSGAVWYDVRHAILLPVWRRYRRRVEAVVVTWRGPGATVAELSAAGISPVHALAIWEAQLVGALNAARGLPVLGVDVDQAAVDPKKWAASAASFLEDLGLELPIGAEERAAEILDRSSTLTDAGRDESVPDEEAAMASRLAGMLGEAHGAHRRWEPTTAYSLSPWTTALLSAERASRLSATQAANAWIAAEDAHRSMTSALSTLEWTVDRLATEALSDLPPS